MNDFHRFVCRAVIPHIFCVETGETEHRAVLFSTLPGRTPASSASLSFKSFSFKQSLRYYSLVCSALSPYLRTGKLAYPLIMTSYHTPHAFSFNFMKILFQKLLSHCVFYIRVAIQPLFLLKCSLLRNFL